MRCVDHEKVGPSGGEGQGTLVRVVAHADSRTDAKPSTVVLGREWERLALDEVFEGEQPGEPPGRVHQRQLLDLVLAQERHRVVGGDALGTGDQRHGRHDRADQLVAVGLEPDVAVGDDAHEHAAVVHDRGAGDAEPAADLVDLVDRRVGTHRDRVAHHAGLGPLDQVDLGRLVLQGQVAVQHADAALAGHGDRHARLGHGVHG